MKYTVVTSCDPVELSSSVNKLMKEGWFLQGGLACEGKFLAQALIKPCTMGDWERPELKRESVYVNFPLDKVPHSKDT